MANLKKVIKKVKLLQTVLKYEMQDAIVQEEVNDKVDKIHELIDSAFVSIFLKEVA